MRFRGVVIHVRNFEGTLKEGDTIRLFNTGGTYIVEEVGYFRIALERTRVLGPGEVGYIIAGIKNISDIRVGDTVTLDNNPCQKGLPGFKDVKPVVFSSAVSRRFQPI